MKIKIEFDYFGNFHRAATWFGGKHIVALSNSWEAAEQKLKQKILDRESPSVVLTALPESKEIEI
jgi:hypothetical protein